MKLTAYELAYIATSDMLTIGVWPGPTALNRWLHRKTSRNLNGVESRARADCLIAAGYVVNRNRWELVA